MNLRSHNAQRQLGEAAFTLIEILVTIAIISLVASGSIYAMLDANRFAATDRAMTTRYSPPDLLPALFVNSLGAIPNPNGSPDRGTKTLPDASVPLYVDQDDGTQVTVPSTRSIRVSLSDSTLGLVRIWVRVDYTFRGKARSYEMYSVRAPD